MEQRIAPTSPKASNVSNTLKGQEPSRAARWSFVIALILGAVGGAISTVLLVLNSDRWVGQISPLQNSVIIRQNTKDYTDRENSNSAFLKKIEPTLLRLFVKKTSETTLEDVVITQKDFLGFGELLTSDGYFISTVDAFPPGSTIEAIDSKENVYPVVSVVKDDVSKLALGKVSGSGFVVADLSDNQSLVPFEPVTVVYNDFGLPQAVLQKSALEQNFFHAENSETLTITSEQYFSSITFDQPQSCKPGSPVYRGDETLLALCSSNTITYLPERQYILAQMLDVKDVRYPFLGVTGIDLAYQKNLPNSFSFGKNAGFLVSAQKKQQAVKVGSPAAKAGIVSGDIILQFGSVELDEGHSLGQALLTAKPNEAIPLRLLRKGKEEKVTVTITQQ